MSTNDENDESNCCSDHEMSDDIDEDASESDVYAAVRIIDEDNKGPRGRKRYLIEWAGTNPETGNIWEPTWEVYNETEGNIGAALISDWKSGMHTNSVSHSDQLSQNDSTAVSGKGICFCTRLFDYFLLIFQFVCAQIMGSMAKEFKLSRL
jgi:hypothetical protein